MAEQVTAEVVSVTFYNEENNFLIARVKAKDEPGTFSIVGSLPRVAPGEELDLTGEWDNHPKYGRQFKVATFERTIPATVNGVRRYLASGLIKGVGEVLASRMIEAFGGRVLEILDSEPEKLLTVEGLGKKKLKTIVDSWEEQREVRSLMLFLQTYEIPTTFAGRIFKLYGAEAVSRIKANPYDLTYDIKGVGFKTADNMALKLGLDPKSRARMEAAILYALASLSEQGHLFYPKDDLFDRVAAMVGEAEPDVLEDALGVLEEKKRVKTVRLKEQDIDAAVYLYRFYADEREITDRLRALASHPSSAAKEKAAAILPELEHKARINLSEEQRRAVLDACASKVFIITGGPGTGKTTIMRMAVGALDKLGHKVKLAAPTGRAAKRLSEASGFPASTLHRLLQYSPDGTFALGEDNKLKADALVVDEASMLDARLFLHVLRALPLTGRLLLVGDVNQLPSVGPGNVLADLLDSQVLPSAVLTRIYRQARESMIVVNSHRINAGLLPDASPKPPPEADFYWVEQDDPVKVREMIVELACERIPRTYGLDPMRDVQVLSPMHKGEAGTMALNDALRGRLNPKGKEIVRGRWIFREGDRILQTRNNYDKDVFNGDLGWIVDVDPEMGEILAEFDGRTLTYDRTELDELSPAYAVSVHKSQGSEYPAVIFPVLTQHFVMLRRNLIYTALTRAKRLAILIGGKKAMHIGLKNIGSEKRYTHLRYRLQEAFNR